MGAVFFEEGIRGLKSSLLGGIIPLIFPGILFLFHRMGAGDIKLLSMTGVFLGEGALKKILVYSFFFGAILGLVKIAFFRKRGKGDNVIPFALAVFFGVILFAGERLCIKN